MPFQNVRGGWNNNKIDRFFMQFYLKKNRGWMELVHILIKSTYTGVASSIMKCSGWDVLQTYPQYASVEWKTRYNFLYVTNCFAWWATDLTYRVYTVRRQKLQNYNFLGINRYSFNEFKMVSEFRWSTTMTTYKKLKEH